MPRPRPKTAIALLLGLLVAALFALRSDPVSGALALVGAVANPLVVDRGRPLARGLILAAALAPAFGVFAWLFAGENPADPLRALLLLLPLAQIDRHLLTERPKDRPA